MTTIDSVEAAHLARTGCSPERRSTFETPVETSRIHSTIRNATERDVAALRALLPDLPASLDHVLVLDGEAGPLAAAVFEIDGAKGRVLELTITTREGVAEIEHRLLDVIENYCRAFGAELAGIGARAA